MQSSANWLSLELDKISYNSFQSPFSEKLPIPYVSSLSIPIFKPSFLQVTGG